jgi:hypothetical protein
MKTFSLAGMARARFILMREHSSQQMFKGEKRARADHAKAKSKNGDASRLNSGNGSASKARRTNSFSSVTGAPASCIVHGTARPEKLQTRRKQIYRARGAEAPTKDRNTARLPNIGKADAGKVPSLEPDRKQIQTFVDALFRYATPGSYVALRSFTHDDKAFSIPFVRLTEGHALIDEAYNEAARAANAKVNVVFCPPVATFSGRDAKRVNVVDGVALTVELDAHPQAARHRLEELLGPATVVVASGGMWLNPATGELEPKLHMHYRLSRPARGDEREFLGKARRLATELVGGDTSNIPISHPIRWPGSWHRKDEPKLCRIDSLNADREIELVDALEILRKVKTQRDSETEAFRAFGEENKPPIDVDQRLADMRYKGEGETGIHKTQLSVTAALLNRGVPIDDVIERVLTATRKAAGKDGDGWDWSAEEQKILSMCESWLKKHPQEEHPQQTAPQEQIEAADLWGNFEPAALPRGLPPKVIEDYAFTMGETMGADPAGFAMAALTVCGAAISDDIKLRMKQHSGEWQECGRLWAALVGLPSFKKTPTMTAAARPLRKRDHEMLRQFQSEQKKYKDRSADERKGVEAPLQKRLCLEDTTIEAAQEVLIGSPNGVLLFQDELSGLLRRDGQVRREPRRRQGPRLLAAELGGRLLRPEPRRPRRKHRPEPEHLAPGRHPARRHPEDCRRVARRWFPGAHAPDHAATRRSRQGRAGAPSCRGVRQAGRAPDGASATAGRRRLRVLRRHHHLLEVR